jgi:membrane-bound metal-dependent hydrolase YbcI (DUF457 family)
MDPVSHAALSRTLLSAFAARRHRARPPRAWVVAAVLGALSPDLDAILMPFGWDRYLRVHEIGTHTIAGTLACAVLTAAAVRVFARTSRYSSLLLPAWLGAASHVLLDLVSSARLRPGWPLVDTAVSLPVVAMADPWLLTLCVAGPVWIWIADRSQDAGHADQPRDAGHADQSSDAALAGAANRPSEGSLRSSFHESGARRSKGVRGTKSPGLDRRTTFAILAVMAAFLLGKSVMGMLAFRNYQIARDASPVTVEARVIEARWAALNTWHVFDRAGSRLRAWRTGAGRPAQEVFGWTIDEDVPLIDRSRSFSTVRNFLRAHELGFAVTIPRPGGGNWVLWSDIRFCWNPASPGAPQVQPIVRSASAHESIACALWFGGELDARGRPVREIVRLGRFTQARSYGE